MLSIVRGFSGFPRGRVAQVERLLAGAALALGVAVSVPANAQSSAPEPEPEPEGAAPRVRFGFDIGPAAGQGSDLGWVAFTGHLRVGVQATDEWALYYQALGGFATSPRLICFSNCGGRDMRFHTSSILADVTLDNRFQLGAGPSLAVYGGIHGDGLSGGASARFSVLFGQLVPPRNAFALGLQLDYIHNTLYLFSLTFGYERL